MEKTFQITVEPFEGASGVFAGSKSLFVGLSEGNQTRSVAVLLGEGGIRLKPTLRIVQAIVYPRQRPNEPVYAVAIKQLLFEPLF